MKNIYTKLIYKYGALLIIFPVSFCLQASETTISVKGDYRYITSDGLPDHTTGHFPNAGNPNHISKQRYHFRVPLHPTFSGRITPLGLSPFGIAINGIPYDPGAAEFWNNDRNSGWQYEALSGAVPLGVDFNNAHVQPNGGYHYHGLPTSLLARLAADKSALVGYAADGFPIYGPDGYTKPNNKNSGIKTLLSSYQVKKGTRPAGPGGRYDGSFVQDYAYVKGSGDLDECNGREGVTPEYPNGTYYYVLTKSFPYIPRCFKGTPDKSFIREPRMRTQHEQRMPGQPPHEAITACMNKHNGDRVRITTPRGDELHAICRERRGQLIAVPDRAGLMK